MRWPRGLPSIPCWALSWCWRRRWLDGWEIPALHGIKMGKQWKTLMNCGFFLLMFFWQYYPLAISEFTMENGWFVDDLLEKWGGFSMGMLDPQRARSTLDEPHVEGPYNTWIGEHSPKRWYRKCGYDSNKSEPIDHRWVAFALVTRSSTFWIFLGQQCWTMPKWWVYDEGILSEKSFEDQWAAFGHHHYLWISSGFCMSRKQCLPF